MRLVIAAFSLLSTLLRADLARSSVRLACWRQRGVNV